MHVSNMRTLFAIRSACYGHCSLRIPAHFGTPIRKIKHGLFYKCRRAKNNNFKKQI